jgi:hypothetical protein
MKKPKTPGPIDDKAHVHKLVIGARLPPIADLPRFVNAIQNMVWAYVHAGSIPDDNVVHHQIRALYYAVRRFRFGEAARRIDELSPRTRDYINKRAERPSIPWKLPASNALRDTATRDEARETILSLLSRGGEWQEGRRRNGVRQMQWVPILCAPALQRNPPKRQAEHDLMLMLALAYFNATGEAPAFNANYGVMAGPFVRLAMACLRLAGATAVDAVSIIRNVQWRRLSMKEQLQLREMQRELLWELFEFEMLERLLRQDDALQPALRGARSRRRQKSS